jgi:hypothetical protein
MALKSVFKKTMYMCAPLLARLLGLFFQSSYLQGRHFDGSLAGYVWALRALWVRNILRLARPMPWPVALSCTISKAENISFHLDNLDNFQSPGTYFQNFNGHIYLGQGTYIAPNVGMITANHKIGALDEYEPGRDIIIGKRCWIGMNAVILPGVTLGSDTIVAAGAVVTKSFPEGGFVIGGIPAKIIRFCKVETPLGGASGS